MRRQHKRQPLVSSETETCPEKKTPTESIPEPSGDIPNLRADPVVEIPTPYVVPPNESAAKVYVPLIKNFISDDEKMWKDGYEFARLREDDTWLNYASAGMELTKKKAGIKADGIWRAEPYGTPANIGGEAEGLGLCVPFTILGDGVVFITDVGFHSDPLKNDNLALKDPMFTITSSLTIVFSGKHWGYAFLLRLIDDRINNAAGRDDPQIVCYSPTTHIIKATCQGWYNWYKSGQGISADHNPWYYNLAMRGEVDILYDWNKINKGGELSAIVTDQYTYSLK